jgi:hypothetical protein
MEKILSQQVSANVSEAPKSPPSKQQHAVELEMNGSKKKCTLTG